jgi:hypothetical protein
MYDIHIIDHDMNQTSATVGSSTSRIKPILIIGLIAGTLDIIAALILAKGNFMGMGQFIASGALGRDVAFGGGIWTCLLGYFFHYLIATTWATIFFLLYPKMKLLQKNKFVVGLLYGVAVWIIMNRVVLPLSQIPQRPFNLNGMLIGMSVLMVMIGLPVSILTHRYYSGKQGVI